MKKEYTELEDFIEDVSFNRWILEKSKKDELIWKEWTAKHPEKWEVMEEAASILIGISFNQIELSETKIQQELDSLHVSITKKEAAFQQPKQNQGSLFTQRLFSIAAVISLLIACTVAVSLFLKPSVIEHRTSFGEFEKIELPDGSQVALNANSSISYKFNQPRKVWLDGEAYFDVLKKTDGQNFQVLTNDLTVKVLGTSFNVNSRYEKTKVFLEEGKVVLEVAELKGNTIEMVPGDLISYSKKSKKILENKTDQTHKNISWRNGVIRFDAAPLPTVLQEITAIYGILFNIQNSQKTDILFSGGIPNDNLAIALENIREVYDVKIEKQGSTYTIGHSKEQRTENRE